MLNHAGSPDLYTRRLHLRRYRSEDYMAMYENWTGDPEVAKYVNWGAHTSPAVTKELVSMWVEGYESPTVYRWGIEKDGELIGDPTETALLAAGKYLGVTQESLQACKRLSERGIELDVDESALRLISSSGCDIQYGARPLRRSIQRMVEDALSEEILTGRIRLGDHVRVVADGDKLAFTPVKSEARELALAGQRNSD